MAKLSLQNWVKIWFSKNPDIFLTKINKNRLIDFFEKNQYAKVTLIYSGNLLNENGKKDLQNFLSQLQNTKPPAKIALLDFDSIEFQNSLSTDAEKSLYLFAQKEFAI